MAHINIPPHKLKASQIQLAIDKLNELEKTNKPLKMELMKLTISGSYDAVYIEMIKRGLLL